MGLALRIDENDKENTDPSNGISSARRRERLVHFLYVGLVTLDPNRIHLIVGRLPRALNRHAGLPAPAEDPQGQERDQQWNGIPPMTMADRMAEIARHNPEEHEEYSPWDATTRAVNRLFTNTGRRFEVAEEQHVRAPVHGTDNNNEAAISLEETDGPTIQSLLAQLRALSRTQGQEASQDDGQTASATGEQEPVVDEVHVIEEPADNADDVGEEPVVAQSESSSEDENQAQAEEDTATAAPSATVTVTTTTPVQAQPEPTFASVLKRNRDDSEDESDESDADSVNGIDDEGSDDEEENQPIRPVFTHRRKRQRRTGAFEVVALNDQEESDDEGKVDPEGVSARERAIEASEEDGVVETGSTS